MARFQEGGVLTQKVSVSIGIFALVLVGAMFCVVCAADDSDAMWVDITTDDTYVGTGDTIKYTVSGDQKYYYKASICDKDYVKSSLGSVSVASSYLSTTKTDGGYYRTLTVTAPTTAGQYYLYLEFYAADDSSYSSLLVTKTVPINVIEPVELSFTLSNNSDSDIKLTVYFVIDGEKIEDSEQEITVSANSTKDVTYDYVVKDLKNGTTYKLCCDDSVLSGSINGLNQEKTFYTEQNSYLVLTVICVIVIVMLIIMFIYVIRKPVVNKGKPKGRR